MLLENNVLAITTKPDFKDYCPPEYYHRAPITKKDVKRVIPQFFVIVGYAAFGVPGVIMHIHNRRAKENCVEIVNSNIKYWELREKAFNTKLEKCDSNKDREKCYAEIEEKELQARTLFEQTQALNRKVISDWYR